MEMTLGLMWLNKTLSHIVENLNKIIDDENINILNQDVVNYLKHFPQLALNYLSEMHYADIISKLVSPFYTASGPVELKQQQNKLEKELLSPQLMIEDDIEIRATQATSDDVSLKRPQEVNKQLLNTLIKE